MRYRLLLVPALALGLIYLPSAYAVKDDAAPAADKPKPAAPAAKRKPAAKKPAPTQDANSSEAAEAGQVAKPQPRK